MNDIAKAPRRGKTTTDPLMIVAGQISGLHAQLEGLVKKSVQTIYQIGELLTQVKEALPHGAFTPWIEEHLPFTDRTARTYMRVYAKFKTETVSVLDDKTITEAYIEAGVKKLLTGPEDEDGPALGPVQAAGDSQLRFDEALLNLPVMSSAILQSYRVKAEGSYLVVGRLGMPPMTFGTIEYPFPPEAQEVESFIRQGIQQVIELGLAKLEELEKAGTVPPPVDETISGQLSRGQKLALPRGRN